MRKLIRRSLKTILAIVLAIVLAVIGFLGGWKSYSGTPSEVQEVMSKHEAESSMLPQHRQPSSKRDLAATFADTQAAVRFSGRLSHGTAAAYAKLRELSPSQLAEVFALAIAAPRTSSGDEMIDLILDCWAQADPDAAVSGCVEAFRGDREQFLERARMPLHYLAERDPQAAFVAWQKHWQPLDKGYDNSSEFQLTSVFRAWGQRDLSAALAAYDAANLGEAGEYAIEGILSQTLDDSAQRDAVLAHLEANGNPGIIAKARETVIENMTRAGDVAKAVTWLEDLPVEPQERAALEEELATHWFRADQRSAAAWLLERSDDGNRPDRIKLLIRDWAGWEPNAAGVWLGEMIRAFGQQADPGIAMFAHRVAAKDPSSALEWLQAVGDPELRLKTAKRLGDEWQRRGESQNITALLSQATLAETDKNIIRERLSR